MFELPFTQLSLWQQQVFSAALLQRMLPNYQYFAQSLEFGNYSLLNNQLDSIWQFLGKSPIKINFEVQLAKLDAEIPSSEQFDVFAVLPAIDACSGMMALMESMQEKNVECAREVSLLSINSITAYLNFVQMHNHDASQLPDLATMQDGGLDDTAMVDLSDEAVLQDPLMQWELAMQTELFELLSSSPESQQTVKAAKLMVTEQKLSNLAIEY